MYLRLFGTEFLRKECPVCGKANWLVRYTPRKVYLDGIPDMPMGKYLKQYCMCPKCGCVYHYRSCAEEWITETVRSKEYQDIWRSDLDTVAKKLTLMPRLIIEYNNINGLWAHYHEEKGQPDLAQHSLLCAIEAARRNEAYNTYILYQTMTPQFQIQREFRLDNDMYLVDFYRRTHQFNKALEQINLLRCRKYQSPFPNLMNYLACEERLVRNQNTQLL